MNKANYWIEKLRLSPHPEGGYFREVYRSDERVSQEALPPEFDGSRNMATSIYYLLKGDQFSAFHKIRSDEIWHFYAGSALTLYIISPSGALTQQLIGDNPDHGEQLQYCIPNNHWFAARVATPRSFALVGCTVAPGFDFSDFQLGKKQELKKAYPQHADLIERYAVN